MERNQEYFENWKINNTNGKLVSEDSKKRIKNNLKHHGYINKGFLATIIG